MACLVAGNSPSLLGSCKSPSIRDSDIGVWASSHWNRSFQTPGTSEIQDSFVRDGLSPVLTNRSENMLWSDSGKSPVMRAVSLSVNVPEENGSIARKCPSPSLKRKRPQRLHIPPQLPGISSVFSAVEQATEVNVESLHYAVSSKKGRRELMEDTHDINNLKLTFDDDVDLVNCSLYKNMRGSLMYLVNIKVDIFYVVNTPSQYMVAPWETHWVVVKHVFIYLRGIVHYGIR